METRLPVSPAVYLRRSGGTATAAWTSGPVERTVAALEAVPAVEETATVECDIAGVTGRINTTLGRVNLAREVRSLTVLPSDADWTLVWERRGDPVVSLAGAFSTETCRTLHTGTTGCGEWPPEVTDRAATVVE